MAKKASANKSQVIRDYKAANPSAAPKEIAESLSKTGVEVSAQFVSTVLSNAKKKAGKKPGKRGPKPKSTAAINVTGGNSFASAMPIFKAAGELLKLAGDKSLAKEALDMVAALRS